MAKDPPYRKKNMMPGMIMLWAGSVETIPSGWHLCDGNAGTPNLLDRFVVCAGGGYAVGAHGEELSHDHFWSSGYFFMDIVAGADIQSGSGYDEDTAYMLLEGDTTVEAHLPPYYALCYIMKLN